MRIRCGTDARGREYMNWPILHTDAKEELARLHEVAKLKYEILLLRGKRWANPPLKDRKL